MLNSPQTLHDIWDAKTWTYFIYSPFMNFIFTLCVVGAWVVYCSILKHIHELEGKAYNWVHETTPSRSKLGIVWFSTEALVSAVVSMMLVGETIRLMTGQYTPLAWIHPDGVGVYMWLARFSVFPAVLGLGFSARRRVNIHYAEIAHLVVHIWTLGVGLSCPHTHSITSITTPCAFVIDRALVSLNHIQVERGREVCVDIGRSRVHMSTAGKSMVDARRIVRLVTSVVSMCLFSWYSSNGKQHPHSSTQMFAIVADIAIFFLYDNISIHSHGDHGSRDGHED